MNSFGSYTHGCLIRRARMNRDIARCDQLIADIEAVKQAPRNCAIDKAFLDNVRGTAVVEEEWDGSFTILGDGPNCVYGLISEAEAWDVVKRCRPFHGHVRATETHDYW